MVPSVNLQSLIIITSFSLQLYTRKLILLWTFLDEASVIQKQLNSNNNNNNNKSKNSILFAPFENT